jgi:hypothetical protein
MEYVTASRQGLSRTTVAQWAALLIAVYVFVAVRPYTGIRHDGMLYLAQALYRLYPEIFGSDVFFKYGSQEGFTIFGRLYALVIGALGVEGASLWMLIASQLLFFSAVILWVRLAVREPHWPLGVLGVSIASGIYGGELVFRYAEPFVTARPFTEALCIFALAAMLANRRWAALILLLVAATLHPLVALPGLAIWWMVQSSDDRRWLWALLALPLFVLLAFQGVRPLDGLLQSYDAGWRGMLQNHNRHLFVLDWSLFDYMMVATDLILAAWLRRMLAGRLRTLLDAALAVAVGGIVLSIIGADLLSNVLITSLQLWRAQWVLHLITMSLLPVLLVPMFRGAHVTSLCAMLVVYAVLSRGLPTGVLALALAVVLSVANARRPIVIDRRILIATACGLIIAFGALWHNNVSWTTRLHALSSDQPLSLQFVVQQYLQRPPMAPALLASALLYLLWRFRERVLVTAALGLVASVIAWTQWDQRSESARRYELHANGDHPFNAFVKPADEVYWLGDALAPWLMMHRRSYVSGVQAAGQAFNRGTAIEVDRRKSVVGLFDFHAQICGMLNKLNSASKSADAPATCAPDLKTVTTACETDHQLGFLVTSYAIENAWVSTWKMPVSENYPSVTYYLYSCRGLLAAANGTPARPTIKTTEAI